MQSMNIHGVVSVELCAANPDNGNSRTIRIVTRNYRGDEHEQEITLYGVTDALSTLPHASDFRGYVSDAAA